MNQSLPRATCESVGIAITAKVPEAQAERDATIALIDSYLHDFAKPTGKCLKCSAPTAGLMGALLGGMEWGIVHGEIRCRTCKWPGRGYHDIRDEAGEKLFDRPLQLALQYHPSVVSSPKGQLEAIATNNSTDPILANIEQGVRDGLVKAAEPPSCVEMMFATGSAYTCNGSSKGCEGERFDGCRYHRTGKFAKPVAAQ